MADISTLQVNNTVYNIKDNSARQMLKTIDVEATTGDTIYTTFYFGDADIPLTYNMDDLISLTPIFTQNNRSAFAIPINNNRIRVYSPVSSTRVIIRATFLDI